MNIVSRQDGGRFVIITGRTWTRLEQGHWAREKGGLCDDDTV